VLDAGAVKAHERDGEARPQFFLELGHHALGGDDEDAPQIAANDGATEHLFHEEHGYAGLLPQRQTSLSQFR
jgi:hypothetical protein